MSYQARVTEDGRLALSDDLAREIGLRPGEVLKVERAGKTLVMTREGGRGDAIGRLRETLSGYSVDQFLAERRDDWGE